MNFIKKDIACNDFSSDKIESSWMLTSEATWRSELLAFYFTDLWFNNTTTVSIHNSDDELYRNTNVKNNNSALI